MQETQVQSLDQEDPLEKETATHSSIIAWKVLWTEEPGGPQSIRLLKLDMTERLNNNNTWPGKASVILKTKEKAKVGSTLAFCWPWPSKQASLGEQICAIQTCLPPSFSRWSLESYQPRDGFGATVSPSYFFPSPLAKSTQLAVGWADTWQNLSQWKFTHSLHTVQESGRGFSDQEGVLGREYTWLAAKRLRDRY